MGLEIRISKNIWVIKIPATYKQVRGKKILDGTLLIWTNFMSYHEQIVGIGLGDIGGQMQEGT